MNWAMLYGQQGTGTIYIYYDAACMDRLEYTNQADPSGGKYVAYHINTLGGAKIILSIGTENPELVAQMPAQTLSCNNSVFNEGLLRMVNQSSTQVFMVRAVGNGRFQISRVAMASLLNFQNNELLYHSPRYQFVFPIITGVIGENISMNKSATNVQFEGLIDRQCTADYIFSISALSGPSMYASVVIVPEIGVVEERSGPNLSEAMGNVMRLQTVNGRPVNDYLQTLCRGERPVPVVPGTPIADEWTARSPDVPVSAEMVVPISQPVNLPTSAPAPVAGNNPCTEISGSGFHVVQRGENLYRLSQQYGVSVSQLREWNGIGSDNIIYPCQKLKVTATSIGQAMPAAYSAEKLAPKGTAHVPVWRTYSGTHTVQPGETIASIAMKYGYSEYRFRYFNNLGTNEVARVGQVLKTSDCECPPAATLAPAASTPMPTSYDVRTPRTPVIGSTTGQATPGAGNMKPLVLGRSDAGTSETEITSNYWKAVMPPPAYSQVPGSYSAENERIPGTSGQLSKGLSDRMSGNMLESTLPESYESKATRRRTHLVGNDENLFTIARRYNTTTENLRRLNSLNPGEEVLAGQRIYIE